MEMVSASKMRAAQGHVIASRPYSERIHKMIADLAVHPEHEGSVHPLLQQRANRERIGIIMMTSDRGFCGGV